MSFRTFVFMAILLSLSTGCVNRHEESVKVYEALLLHDKHTLFVRESVSNHLAYDQFIRAEDRDLFASYTFSEEADLHLLSDFGSLSVHLIPDDELEALFNEGCEAGWKGFDKKYPDADNLIELSRVGFRDDYSEAIVYFSVSSDCLAGEGYFVIFKKEDGAWVKIRKIDLWIS